MKYSPKKTAPDCLTEWLSLANENWTPSWGGLKGDPKTGTFAALLEEQGHVCAYCGRRIGPDEVNGHIDHFWPRSDFSKRSLDYGNFFASCGPSGEKGKPSTCGDAKKNWYDSANDVIPSSPDCERRFRFNASGEVSPARKDDALVSMMIEVLNLNEPLLVEDRKKLILSAEFDEDQEGAQALIRRHRSLDGTRRLPSLGHAVACSLEDEFSI